MWFSQAFPVFKYCKKYNQVKLTQSGIAFLAAQQQQWKDYQTSKTKSVPKSFGAPIFIIKPN